jgi:hypothetical protein
MRKKLQHACTFIFFSYRVVQEQCILVLSTLNGSSIVRLQAESLLFACLVI